ncbi:N-acetylneuraminate synthase family protein [Desulfobacter vibrioformis]|uniref:N-acetylneuraminate synthase family protein n=1 Tax=Desulfobacter vibrioformis TaxID=34031 RepID=UPI000A01A99A|nr:N-acetylneuraminate synthase family protein [Desulfobacter vibrioformis]
MAKSVLRDGTDLSDFGMPYIVAEINTSHNGDIETAKEMIGEAKKAGCSCVKFQSWSKESLYSKTYYDQNPVAGRIMEKFALSEAQLMEMAEYSRQCGISFSSTPYCRKEVDFLLEKCDAAFVKVASMELNNYPFLDYIARTGAPMVLATGMGSMDDVKKAVETIKNAGNTSLCILHCISIYPPELSTIRLKNILGLRQAFPDCPVGFSDHSIGIEVPVAAVALGAALIEKHFTLDKTKIGMDNQMATEPDEMSRLVQSCRNVQMALGGTERIVLEAELVQRQKMRRSIIASRDLQAGTVIREEDLDAKRPGTGLAPENIKDLIGKTLKVAVEKDTLLYSEALF